MAASHCLTSIGSNGTRRLISLRHRDPVFALTVRTAVFGHDNRGKINDFGKVLDGAPVCLGQPFEESDLFTSFRQVFIDGDRWEAMPERLERDIGPIRQSMQRNGHRNLATGSAAGGV